MLRRLGIKMMMMMMISLIGPIFLPEFRRQASTARLIDGASYQGTASRGGEDRNNDIGKKKDPFCQSAREIETTT
jgi:hypothetical protein